MKRFEKVFVFAIVFVVSLFGILSFASAQSFSVEKTFAEENGDVDDYISVLINIKNLKNEDLNLRVDITNKEKLPEGWQTQICFFQNCFPPGVDTKDGIMAAQYEEHLDITFMTGSEPDVGEVEVTVTDLDDTNNKEILTFKVTAVTVYVEGSPVPSALALSQNYPNPFSVGTSAITRISFTNPSAGHVSLEVYNLLGQGVRTLVNDFKTAGQSTVAWDGRDYNGNFLPAGIYMYKLSAGGKQHSRRLMLTR